MKLAEALMNRSEVQNKLTRLTKRVENNILIQEGDEPSEDPRELLKQINILTDELAHITLAINKTNVEAQLRDGRTMTQALAERESLRQLSGVYNSLLSHCTPERSRYSSREIRWVNVLPVSELNDKADRAARCLRELNAAIQEANWQIEVT